MTGRPAGCTGKLVRLPVWKGGHGHAKERIEGAVLCSFAKHSPCFMFNLEHQRKENEETVPMLLGKLKNIIKGE